MIAQLIEDHERLRAIARELERFLGGNHAPVDIQFCRLRWSLCRELLAHVARERALLGTVAAADPAEDALEAMVREHMARWDFRAIERQWERYRFATRTLLRQLHAQMAREEVRFLPRQPSDGGVVGHRAPRGSAGEAVRPLG